MPQTQDLQNALSRAIKRSGFTRAEVGEKLGLTRSTVQRMLSGGNLSTARLLQVLEVIGLSLAEFTAGFAEKTQAPAPTLSTTAQKRLLENFKAFALYWKTAVERCDIARVQKDADFSDRDVERLRAILKDAGLDPEHAALFSLAGDGPLYTELRTEWSARILERAKNKPGDAHHALDAFLLTPQSAQDLKLALQAVHREFFGRAKVEAAGQDVAKLKAISVVSAVTEGSLLENYRRA